MVVQHEVTAPTASSSNNEQQDNTRRTIADDDNDGIRRQHIPAYARY
jgi:hypothetical protein